MVTNILQNIQQMMSKISKWWQNFHFLVNYPFNVDLTVVRDWPTRRACVDPNTVIEQSLS